MTTQQAIVLCRDLVDTIDDLELELDDRAGLPANVLTALVLDLSRACKLMESHVERLASSRPARQSR